MGLSWSVPAGCLELGGTFVAVLPGDTWNFQAWYRDVGGTNNSTDGVEITFQ
jgi:hypothetical protein